MPGSSHARAYLGRAYLGRADLGGAWYQRRCTSWTRVKLSKVSQFLKGATNGVRLCRRADGAGSRSPEKCIFSKGSEGERPWSSAGSATGM